MLDFHSGVHDDVPQPRSGNAITLPVTTYTRPPPTAVPPNGSAPSAPVQRGWQVDAPHPLALKAYRRASGWGELNTPPADTQASPSPTVGALYAGPLELPVQLGRHSGDPQPVSAYAQRVPG